MHPIIENFLIMVLTIVILIGGAYVILLILDWGLKRKSGSREQEGLTSLWASAHKRTSGNRNASDDRPSPIDPSAGNDPPPSPD